MRGIELVLSRLDKVKDLGAGKYTALCPAHQEKTPSMSIRHTDDDRILMHCFGCGANGLEIMEAMGLDAWQLYPEKQKEHYERQRIPFPAHQVLSCLQFEAQIIMIAAKRISENNISGQDLKRVNLANKRIYEAMTYAKQF